MNMMSQQPTPAQKKPFAEEMGLLIVKCIAAGGGLTAALLVSPLTGALSGFVLSLIIPNWICGGFIALGLNVHPGDLYKIGAVAGWVGGFLRYSPNFSKKDPKK